MVNLEDAADCEKAIGILKRHSGRDCGPAGKSRGGNRGWGRDAEQAGSPSVAELPLPQKLNRIRSRGMWKHLVKIAQDADKALSLPEMNELPKNKMRSLKAIIAKLENRFELKFLKVDADAGEDASGNPRYIMLPNLRRQILRLVEA